MATVLTAIIFIILTKKATKEMARPNAAPPFVEAVNIRNIVAVKGKFKL